MAWREFLQIHRRGNDLVVRVDTMIPDIAPHAFELTFNRGCPIDAECVARHLRETFGNLVVAARRDAYAAGYKAGRAKRAKGDWGFGGLGRQVP